MTSLLSSILKSKAKQVFKKAVPATIRHELIRRSFRIPFITKPGYEFKIATTQNELISAFRLLHDCYAGNGLMDPDPSGMRCTLYSALPYTTAIIGKFNGVVVGSLSVIKDSPIGFPSDKEYRTENDRYRQQGYRLVEISGFSVHPKFRHHGHQVALYLFKFMYEYLTKHMGCDMFCISIHPRAEDFYSALFGFRRNGGVTEYEFVKGALAIHMSVDARESGLNKLKVMYDGAGPERDLYSFIKDAPAPFTFPRDDRLCLLDPVMTPDMLEYFFVEKTNLFASLSPDERALVRDAYRLRYPLEIIRGLDDTEMSNRRLFRYLVDFPAVVICRQQVVFGKALDLSAEGLFLQTDSILQGAQNMNIQFNLGNEVVKIPVTSIWRNDKQVLRYPNGYGLRFMVNDDRIRHYLACLHESMGSNIESSRSGYSVIDLTETRKSRMQANLSIESNGVKRRLRK